MIVKRILLLVIAYILGIGEFACAQQIPFQSREVTIFNTMSQLQEREAAYSNAIQEAELKAMERPAVSRVVPVVKQKTEKSSDNEFFSSLARRTHPYVNIGVTQDDNFKSAPVKRSDTITTINPGFKMNFYSGPSSTAIDANIDSSYNKHYPDNNNIQTAGTSVVTNQIIGPYTLTFSDTYSSNYISTPELGIPVDTLAFNWQNSILTSLSRNFNRYGFNVGYSRGDSYYDQRNIGSESENESWTLSQYLRVATKTRLVFDYSHGRSTAHHSAFDSSNNNSNAYTLTATGILSPKVSVLTKISYTGTNNKSGANTISRSFGSSLAYRLSDRTNLNFTYTGTLLVSGNKTSNSVDNSFSLSGNHRFAFNPKLNLSMGYSFDPTTYPKTEILTGELTTYSFDASLSYAFKQWLDVSFGYTRTKTAANNSNDYHDNQYILKAQAHF
ncbi:MAG TPA: hypothetical protein PKL77_09975 [Candidatus Omnitrophota bacterium]|nr:hypothetical protein [Candidatus Omnitrophota bacterium]HPT06701.1 hypothetical protein [Candidatus Omnitrophota bacterium]